MSNSHSNLLFNVSEVQYLRRLHLLKLKLGQLQLMVELWIQLIPVFLSLLSQLSIELQIKQKRTKHPVISDTSNVKNHIFL